jgi:hypothetical protein
MSDISHLYRGDSIHNSQTKPGGFRSEGIRSAAFEAAEIREILRTLVKSKRSKPISIT